MCLVDGRQTPFPQLNEPISPGTKICIANLNFVQGQCLGLTVLEIASFPLRQMVVPAKISALYVEEAEVHGSLGGMHKLFA